MKFDQNQKDLKSQELVNKVIKVIYELQSLSAFHNDEFLALGYEKFEEYAKNQKLLKRISLILRCYLMDVSIF